MARGADQLVMAEGETPDGSPWKLAVRLDGEQREIDLQVVGSGGGGVSGPHPLPENVISICMIGGKPDHYQHIVGEVAPTVDRVSISLDDDREIDAVLVRSNLGDVDYFVTFAPWEGEVIDARAFDRHGQLLAVHRRSNIELWRNWRVRRTKPGP